MIWKKMFFYFNNNEYLCKGFGTIFDFKDIEVFFIG
jgi:hypothetical protein